MGILSEKVEGKVISVVIESSNINGANYHTETKVLTITFKNGSIYEYEDIPWEVFTKFRMNESQGKYFNANISKKYKFKKVS